MLHRTFSGSNVNSKCMDMHSDLVKKYLVKMTEATKEKVERDSYQMDIEIRGRSWRWPLLFSVVFLNVRTQTLSNIIKYVGTQVFVTCKYIELLHPVISESVRSSNKFNLPSLNTYNRYECLYCFRAVVYREVGKTSAQEKKNRIGTLCSR